MEILRPVVQAFVRTMFDAEDNVALCGAVGSQLICDHDARCMPLFLRSFRIRRLAILVFQQLCTST